MATPEGPRLVAVGVGGIGSLGLARQSVYGLAKRARIVQRAGYNTGVSGGCSTVLAQGEPMTIHELSEPDCLALIERAPFARLGCAYLAQPYIVPVQLALDADARCLYGFSLAGQKVAWMRRNPKVCVAVDEVADKDHWSSVLVTGRYQEVGAEAATEPRRRAEALLQRRREWWLPGAAETSAAVLGEPVFFRVVIASISGRRASRSTPASAS